MHILINPLRYIILHIILGHYLGDTYMTVNFYSILTSLGETFYSNTKHSPNTSSGLTRSRGRRSQGIPEATIYLKRYLQYIGNVLDNTVNRDFRLLYLKNNFESKTCKIILLFADIFNNRVLYFLKGIIPSI